MQSILSIDKDGYYQFGFKYKSKKYSFKLHHVLAMCFIPNPDNLPAVHHIDGNRKNNSLENLIWVSEDEHRILHGQKPIACYSKDGELVKIYNSISSVEKDGHHPSHVNFCCNKKSGFRSHHGLIWKFITFDESNKYKKVN